MIEKKAVPGIAVRRLVIGLSLSGWFLIGACGPGEAPGKIPAEPVGPSIILISFDTCRADLFGVLSGEQPSLTPRLDEFAADAVIFDKAFVQAPHTLPSHMSMFTSVYPDVHGVKPEQDPLPESFTTLPQILQQAGYRNIGLVTTEWLKPEFGFGRGFDKYERLSHRPTYVERVNEAALRQLKSADQEATFLFLHYYDLHSDFEHFPSGNKLPYYSPPEFRKSLGVSPDGQEFCNAEGQCNTRYLISLDQERRQLPQEEIETIHDLYRAAMPHLDSQMGAFFDELKRRGLYDRALILITSDHGEEFREHGRFIHSQPYDETLQVPLFLKFPQAWKGGTRFSAVVETVDILPTLLDFLDIEPPVYIQGESLLPLIEGGPDRRKDAVLSQDTINLRRYGLRTADFKFIMDVNSARRELYALQSDPAEKDNLATERVTVVEELETRLRHSIRTNQILNERLADGVREGEELLSPEERERLQSLGYLE